MRRPVVYLFLIFEILKSQKDIVRVDDVYDPEPEDICLSYKLFEGKHIEKEHCSDEIREDDRAGHADVPENVPSVDQAESQVVLASPRPLLLVNALKSCISLGRSWLSSTSN